MGSVDSCCESSEGGSAALDESAKGSADGPPATAETESTLEFDGGSDGGSASLTGDAVELLGRETGSAEAITGDWVGLALPDSSVLAGGATGSLGRDAGLAGPAEGMARPGVVVGAAGVGTGVGVGLAGGVGASNTAGVNAIGGSKRAKVLNPKESVNSPVQPAAHIGSRENISSSGSISGSHGGPIVVTTVPSADVLFPKPQVGQARSRTSSGAKPAAKSSSVPGIPLGSFHISPTVKLSIWL